MSALQTAGPPKKTIFHTVLATLAVPVLLFVALFSLKAGWPGNAREMGFSPAADRIEQGGLLLLALCWIAFGFLFNRACHLLLWRGLLVRAGIQVPAMLVTLTEVVLWIAIVAVILGSVYGHSVTALLATSTVLIGVAGFAVQRLLADFFAGIALSMERPYGIGDWLQVDTGGPVGKVVDFGWRSTRMTTPEDITMVVPNSHLAGRAFLNFSRPHKYFRDRIRITLPYDVTTHQGQRILLGAVNQIDEIASLPGKPSVTIEEYDSRGVVWLLIYMVPDRGRLMGLRFMVHQNILRNLHYAGVQIPVQAQEIRVRRSATAGDVSGGIVRLLRQSALFADLQPEETEELAHSAMQRLHYAPEPILRQGNPGTSLFILNEGLLGVWVADAQGVDKQVARIQPGEFFGELSLLTGAPRGATVIPVTDCLITEIGKDAMSKLLEARPELAVILSQALAGRQAANQRSMAAAGLGSVDAGKEGLARQILGRIRTFFNLGGK